MQDTRLASPQTRFAGSAPQPTTYNKEERSVHAVISTGSPVNRFYGTEVLRISPEAVDLTRMKSAGIPLLNSHNQHSIDQHLGRITQTWFKRNALMGKIVFNDTDEGRKAEGMVSRNEIAGISAGYVVHEWEITDSDGRIVDPEKTRINFDDMLTFTASRWELLEASLVSVPADPAAAVRSLGQGEATDVAVRDALHVLARQLEIEQNRSRRLEATIERLKADKRQPSKRGEYDPAREGRRRSAWSY